METAWWHTLGKDKREAVLGASYWSTVQDMLVRLG